MKIWGNHRMAQIVSYLTGKRMYDVSCGFRAYSREALLQLVLTGRFTYTQETLLDLASKGLVIDEMPMVVRGEREFGKSRVAQSWRYGTKTMGIIFGVIRDYRPGVLLIRWPLGHCGPHLGDFLFRHRFNVGLFNRIFGPVYVCLFTWPSRYHIWFGSSCVNGRSHVRCKINNFIYCVDICPSDDHPPRDE